MRVWAGLQHLGCTLTSVSLSFPPAWRGPGCQLVTSWWSQGTGAEPCRQLKLNLIRRELFQEWPRQRSSSQGLILIKHIACGKKEKPPVLCAQCSQPDLCRSSLLATCLPRLAFRSWGGGGSSLLGPGLTLKYKEHLSVCLWSRAGHSHHSESLSLK